MLDLSPCCTKSYGSLNSVHGTVRQPDAHCILHHIATGTNLHADHRLAQQLSSLGSRQCGSGRLGASHRYHQLPFQKLQKVLSIHGFSISQKGQETPRERETRLPWHRCPEQCSIHDKMVFGYSCSDHETRSTLNRVRSLPTGKCCRS